MLVLRPFFAMILAGALFGIRSVVAPVAPAPVELAVRVVDEDGATIDARVRLRRLGGSSTIGTALAGREPARFRLERERVRVVVARGPEWTIDARTLDLRDATRGALTATLTHAVDRAPYLATDLHVHTDASPDGRISLQGRLATIAAEDLDHAVLTDHNRLTRAGDERAITGAEITTSAPEVGHFNAFPLESLPRFRGTTARAIFEAVHADPRALVQINHPRLDDHIAYFELAALDERGRVDEGFSLDADLLEVWNGYDLARPERVDRVFQEWLALRALGHRLVATGGSDSHGLERPTLGLPRTYVAPRAGEAWTEALRRGAAFVSNGPWLDVRVDEHRPGDPVPLSGPTRVAVRIEIRAAPSVDVRHGEIFVGRRLVRTFEVPRSTRALRYDARVPIDVAPGDEVVVRVRGDRTLDDLTGRSDVSPCAFTNPIPFTSSSSPRR